MRMNGLGTGTLIFSEAIASLELDGVRPGFTFGILDHPEAITLVAVRVVDPAILTGKVITPNGTHIFDRVAHSFKLRLRFHCSTLYVLLMIHSVESRERMRPGEMRLPGLVPWNRRLLGLVWMNPCLCGEDWTVARQGCVAGGKWLSV